MEGPFVHGNCLNSMRANTRGPGLFGFLPQRSRLLFEAKRRAVSEGSKYGGTILLQDLHMARQFCGAHHNQAAAELDETEQPPHGLHI